MKVNTVQSKCTIDQQIDTSNDSRVAECTDFLTCHNSETDIYDDAICHSGEACAKFKKPDEPVLL